MTISFSRLGNMGRIGNQLMQIASTIGLAEKHNMAASFPNWAYESYFENPLPHGAMIPNQIKEKQFTYYEWDIPAGGCDILGYLQSEKYFAKNIREQFKFKQPFLQAQKDRYPLQDKTKICIQVRRGDYVGNPNYYQLPITYYIDSLYRYFPDWKDCQIIIISDDIEYCKVHFECLPNVIFSSGTEIEDIAIASICDHFIIANSSFGWWAAYLGEKKHSKIIHPGHLCIGSLGIANNPKDYWPTRWTENKQDGYKLPLKDVTFTIPVFMDHEDRKKNADLTVCILQTNFDTSIIMCEQGGSKFEYMKQWVKYYQDNSKDFHRTKMLNDMANMANTDIVVNYDCDVIIPPMQMLAAVEALRNGADMVFPYDGRFARLPRNQWFNKISHHLDIGLVGNTKCKGREHGHNSVGGCVLFNKDAFIDGGMENENMISFGPEDCERNDRFKRLGFDVRQIGGSLFHMDHFVGVNSGTKNPHFKANHAELEKIRAMSDIELIGYVNTWPWCHKYTSQYYSEISEGAIRSAKEVMALIPHTDVFDVGCGVGEWNNGNPKYLGIDYRVKESDLLFSKDNFREFNLNKEFPLMSKDTNFSLAICLEVAEHLRPHRAKPLIDFLCSLSDTVLFSAAIPYQGGTGHVNEQWQTYWEKLFNDNGFGAAEKQPEIRNNQNIDLYYRQNIVLYAKGGKGKVTNFVLPEYYEQIVKGR